jgi:nucleotide-binding universal stress UspA family protein
MENLKILIPTDFSVQAEYAFRMVQKLEAIAPLQIHFLHVLTVPDTVTLNAAGEIETCGEIDVQYVREQKEIAERKLANLSTLYGEHIQGHLLLGKITDGILQYAASNHFDLIAMGTKGAWGIKEKLSGSETQIIARKSTIPVLSLMCDRSDLVLKNILLVHDFSHPAPENMQLIQKMIAAFAGNLHMLQIVSGNVAEVKSRVEANMKQFAALNHITSYQMHVLHDKDVENGVIHFNQMNNMDLICVGTHGRAGVFHHSAAEKIINHLFKPVLSFHLHN